MLDKAKEIYQGMMKLYDAKGTPQTLVVTSDLYDNLVRPVHDFMYSGIERAAFRPHLFGLSVVVRDDMPDGVDWIISQRPPWHFDGVATVDELREAGLFDYLEESNAQGD